MKYIHENDFYILLWQKKKIGKNVKKINVFIVR